MGLIFVILYVSAIVCAVLYALALLSRAVTAHERAAGALERIAHKMKSDAP